MSLLAADGKEVALDVRSQGALDVYAAVSVALVAIFGVLLSISLLNAVVAALLAVLL